MFTVQWKYEVEDSNLEEFKNIYGDNGEWFKLFKKAEYYIGSNLIISKTGIVILNDTWKSKEAYYTFIKENEIEYNEMSKNYRRLYKSENLIGYLEET